MTTRREVVAATATFAVLVAARALAVPAYDPAAALLGAVRSRDSAQAVGATYLAAHPDEADAGALVRILASDPATGQALAAGSDPVVLARALAAAVRADFLARRVVKLDGWIVSRTEARLCCLVRLA